MTCRHPMTVIAVSWHPATLNSRHQILFNSANVNACGFDRHHKTAGSLSVFFLTCEFNTTVSDFMTTYQKNSWRNRVIAARVYGRLVASWLTEQWRTGCLCNTSFNCHVAYGWSSPLGFSALFVGPNTLVALLTSVIWPCVCVCTYVQYIHTHAYRAAQSHSSSAPWQTENHGGRWNGLKNCFLVLLSAFSLYLLANNWLLKMRP
jgi:hypothetical protein